MGKDMDLEPVRRGIGCCLCIFLQLAQLVEEVEKTEGSQTSWLLNRSLWTLLHSEGVVFLAGSGHHTGKRAGVIVALRCV